MADSRDIHELQALLATHRRTLQLYLRQVAIAGTAHIPPTVAHGLDEARQEIRRIKQALRDQGVPAADQLYDAPAEDPAGASPDGVFENGTDLFASGNPYYQDYLPTAAVAPIIEAILVTPGYHVIESEGNTGKTALIGHLWRNLRPARPLIAYLFSRDRGRTSVRRAITSIYQQIDQILGPAGLLPERANALSYRVISSVAEQAPGLTILIDGLDECDRSEHIHMLDLLPDGHVRSLTFIITTRPTLEEQVLRHLPAYHTLRYNRPPEVTRHRLPFLSLGDVAELLQRLTIADRDGTIARRIQEQSKGRPSWIGHLRSIPAERASWNDILDRMAAFWTRDRDSMHSLCPHPLRPLLDRLLAVLAVAKSELTLDNLAEILGCDERELIEIQASLGRYLLVDANRKISFSDGHLREHLEELIGDARCEQADRLLHDWVKDYARRPNLQQLPLYVLRHAAEYLADEPDLWQFLARREWFETLQQRTNSRSACIEAILRVWSAVVETVPSLMIDQQIVNLIACAIVRTSLTATLLPELVLKLVELGFWSAETARDYAYSYELADNKRAVMDALENPLIRPNIPAGTAAAVAAAELELHSRLSPARRATHLTRWMRKWEPLSAHADPQTDSERLNLLLDALGQPVDLSDAPIGPQRLVELLDDLGQYQPPPTGQIGDPVFESLLGEIAETWPRVSPDLACEQVVTILQQISRTSRTDLLGALEILAPAIGALFPQSIDELRVAAKTVVTAYLT